MRNKRFFFLAYLRVRNLRGVNECAVDRVKLEEIRVLLRIALLNVGLFRAGDGQQFLRVAPFRVQWRLQIAAYCDGRYVVERSQHDDGTVGQANGQYEGSIICACTYIINALNASRSRFFENRIFFLSKTDFSKKPRLIPFCDRSHVSSSSIVNFSALQAIEVTPAANCTSDTIAP